MSPPPKDASKSRSMPTDEMVNAIRFLSADAVQKANSGHPGMPMGMADVASVLFTKYLKFDPSLPDWPDRDRFVLSAGHGSMLLYSLLYLTGYKDMTLEEIKNFRQLGAKTAGHPEYGHAAGIETTTGPLGQGITNAVGMALAERIMNARYGDDLVDHFTYVIAGDGCLMEGISQEAISFAGHLKLSKLIVFWDDNRISIDGKTELATSEDQIARFKAAGWDVRAIDGHDRDAVADAVEWAQSTDGPAMIACRTTIGYGAPNLAGTEKTHGSPLGDEEIAAARKKLGWTHDPFEIPKEVQEQWRAAGGRGESIRQKWEEALEAAPADVRDRFNEAVNGHLPAGWENILEDHLKKLSDEQPKVATRKASQMALEVLTADLEDMIGGSADLTGSNLTKTDATAPITPGDYSGRYVYYGVREHAMAAMMSGMALHGGIIPYGGTFLVFADYMRPAMRLCALMGLRVIYVMTHDSIGLGEDGPTHQPVETLASLRAMPNMTVFRPADAVETAECWALALKNTGGPSVLSLTRQGVPTLRAEFSADNLCGHGAYVLAGADGDRQATILATGSEVAIALEAKESLEKEGIPTAVVSIPSQELFDAQDDDYKARVLGDGVRVAVEAAVRFGWEKYIGPGGGFVGMSSFGASAPGGDLYQHFGITAEAVVKEVKARLS